MKKLKTALEEQEFLKNASVEEVRDYISLHTFKFTSEEVFIGMYPELVPYYIELHGLCQKAARTVIISKDRQNIEVLLKSKPKNYSIDALFVEHGDYKQVVAWLKNNESSKYPEKDLFWGDDVKKIITFVKKHKVSSFGQKDLIMKNVASVVKHLILYDRLNDKNRILATKTASQENVWLLIMMSEGKNDYKVLKQISDVRFCKNLKKLVHTRLIREAELLFIETAPFDLVVEYAKNCGLLEIADYLLARPKDDGIIKFLSKNKLSPKCEMMLFDRGCHTEIKAYIKTHELSVDGEVRFIKRGYHREIMLYLKKRSLSAEAQVELIKRGNGIEIMELVSKYQLADVAAELLLKRGVKEEIEVWTENIVPQCVDVEN